MIGSKRVCRRQLFKQWLLAITLALVGTDAIADCSPFAGLASINEIVDENNNKFIEIKRLSSALTWGGSDAWGVEFCVTGGSCTGVIDLAPVTTSDSLYRVLKFSKNDSPTIDLTGMDVRLVDSDGNTVDYVRVGDSFAAEDPSCPIDSPELIYDNELDLVGGQSGKYARRTPDGTGDWGLAAGASAGGESEEESNDDVTVLGPTININNLTVEQGDVAAFTVSLSSPAGRDFQFDFQTRDLTAVQGTDYEYGQGTVTVAAGHREATINVQTLNSGAAVEREFFIIIGNARDLLGLRYGRFASQAGVATIQPFVSRLDRFRVDVADTASVCSPVEVVVSALDDTGAVINDYEGSIGLSTTSGSGNWSQGPGDPLNGVLTPDPDQDNDGQARYTFTSADNGTASFYLTNRTADVLEITALDTVQGKQGTSQAVTFRENAFVIESVDANGVDIVAERDHQFQVRAVGREPGGSECQLIAEYDGNVPLKTWLARTFNDAGGASPALESGVTNFNPPNVRPSSNNLTLAFNGGIASLVLQTTDVAQYRLNLADDTSGYVVDENGDPIEVAGQSDALTVRPDRFEVSVTDNPGATDANGAVFVAAGQSFEVRVAALGALGGTLVSYGNEGTPQGAELSHTLFLPAGGSPGNLTGTTVINGDDFVSGANAINDIAWNEVGIIELTATNPGYLGVTPAIVGDSGPVGRFIPDRFEVVIDDGALEAFCTISTPFLYSGQDSEWLLPPELMITAYSVGNDVTQNYTASGFQKLTSADIARTEPNADTTALGTDNAPLPVTVTSNQGSLTVAAPGVLTYTYASTDTVSYDKLTSSRVGPVDPELTYTVNSVVDSDGVAGAGAPYNLLPLMDFEVQYGRLDMENVYGPENLEAGVTLAMPFYTEYWDGARFVLNDFDECTDWNTTDITNTEQFHTLESGSGTVAGGVGGPLQLDPNGTEGTDTLTWAVPAWLQDDADGDGALENPSALATFGVYRGNDRVIYWQER